MSDICIIYVRKDARKQASRLDALLRSRWKVWWDKKIDNGDYREAIKRELVKAGCVVPIWSVHAENSAVLHDELEIAAKNNVPIVPIRIHDVPAPLGYGSLQVVDALDWNGEDVTPAVLEHLERIDRVLENSNAGKQRPTQLNSPATDVPAFFFSVSSHETRVEPGAALDALNLFGVSSILVSAYDMEESRRSKGTFPVLRELRKKGTTVLLDSGKYEMARRGDKHWTLSKYHKALRETPHDMAFCYDNLDPPTRLVSAVKDVVGSVERDVKRSKSTILPIVHLPHKKDKYDVGIAPQLVKNVAKELRPLLVAIPERELGLGIIERTKTMWSIRQALSELHFYQPIHILGTGNPISIALLCAAGADSFDGLEWCRYALDGETHTLHHFQHYDLYQWQDPYAVSQVTRAAVSDDAIRFSGRAVFHNLDIYTSWLNKLRAAMRDDKRLVELMTKLLPGDAMELARTVLPGVL